MRIRAARQRDERTWGVPNVTFGTRASGESFLGDFFSKKKSLAVRAKPLACNIYTDYVCPGVKDDLILNYRWFTGWFTIGIRIHFLLKHFHPVTGIIRFTQPGDMKQCLTFIDQGNVCPAHYHP